MKHIGTIILALALALPAWGHGGEDHGDTPAPPVTTEAAPRAAAASEEFELVAALEGDRLHLYLDRFASNEPVADALVEVDDGTSQAIATPIAPGRYALPVQAFTKPGRHALTVSVQTEDTADLLSITLELSAPIVEAAQPRPYPWERWALWGASGALLLIVGGLVVPRAHKKTSPPKAGTE